MVQLSTVLIANTIINVPMGSGIDCRVSHILLVIIDFLISVEFLNQILL